MSATPVATFTVSGPLTPTTGVIVGGSWMLDQFFRDVAGLNGGQLVMAVPFIDAGISELATSWEEMHHEQIDVVLVTGVAGSQSAWKELKQYPWRSLLICQNRTLHAKIYSFLSDELFGTCLVGSHNLTSRALNANLEAGVLLRTDPCTPEVQAAVTACHEHVLSLAEKSKIFIDTNAWPVINETQTTNGGCDD